ncbi:MAG TPA: glycosyltransferase [Thermoleophilaceae bacterium]
MSVLMTVSDMSVGGAERMVAQLTVALHERGRETVVAAAPGPLDADLEAAGIERELLPRGSRSPLRAAAVVGALARVTARVSPELVHAHNPRIAASSAIAARVGRPLARPPVLATFHGVLPSEYGVAARLLRLADHVVCVSAEIAHTLERSGVRGERLSVIPNAVEAVEPLNPERRAALDSELGLGEAPVFSIVARLVPQKAHERFLEAARIVAESHPETRFLIVGDGPLRAQMEGLAGELNLGDQVLFTGVRADARDIIARSRALVFSSNWEGLSVAALEALSAGVPVVSTDVEGMREMLGSGAGVMVGRDPAELAAAITRLIERPDDAEQMGTIGRELARTVYSPPAMAAAYDNLYDGLIAAR